MMTAVCALAALLFKVDRVVACSMCTRSPALYDQQSGMLLACGDCILNRSTWNLRCAALSKRRCRLRSVDAASSHTVDLTVTPWKLAKPAGMAADELLLSASPATAAASLHQALWDSFCLCHMHAATCCPGCHVEAMRKANMVLIVQPAVARLALHSRCRPFVPPFLTWAG